MKAFQIVYCLANKDETKFLCVSECDITFEHRKSNGPYTKILSYKWIKSNFDCYYDSIQMRNFNHDHKKWIKERNAHWVKYYAKFTEKAK